MPPGRPSVIDVTIVVAVLPYLNSLRVRSGPIPPLASAPWQAAQRSTNSFLPTAIESSFLPPASADADEVLPSAGWLEASLACFSNFFWANSASELQPLNR